MCSTNKCVLFLVFLSLPLLAGARGCEDPGGGGGDGGVGCVCPEIWAPVCGADGVTYGNECEASCAGVPIDHDGECSDPGYCFEDAECGDGERCNLDDCHYISPCGDEMGDECPAIAVCAGICEPDPGHGECCEGEIGCTGCDGTTFCVDASTGGCPALLCPPPLDCGGFIGLTCPGGMYCDFPDDSCGFADAGGWCVPIPDTWIEIYAPVCGCDGVTYSNEGEANGAGVDIQHHGACAAPPPPPEDCRSTGCPRGSYCGDCWGSYACIPDGAIC